MKNETVAYAPSFAPARLVAKAAHIAPKAVSLSNVDLPEILFITSYPPRECGIATYSQDLLKALDNKFLNSFSLKVCALEAGTTDHVYPDEVKYVLDTTDAGKYIGLANAINSDADTKFIFKKLARRRSSSSFTPSPNRSSLFFIPFCPSPMKP